MLESKREKVFEIWKAMDYFLKIYFKIKRKRRENCCLQWLRLVEELTDIMGEENGIIKIKTPKDKI